MVWVKWCWSARRKIRDEEIKRRLERKKQLKAAASHPSTTSEKGNWGAFIDGCRFNTSMGGAWRAAGGWPSLREDGILQLG